MGKAQGGAWIVPDKDLQVVGVVVEVNSTLVGNRGVWLFWPWFRESSRSRQGTLLEGD